MFLQNLIKVIWIALMYNHTIGCGRKTTVLSDCITLRTEVEEMLLPRFGSVLS
jgi:hypothetical protein